MKEANLPSWAEVIAPGKIKVDAQEFYPAFFEEFWHDDSWPAEGKMSEIDRGEIDQYWLEVAFQCMKLDVQYAVAGTKLQAKSGGALVIIVKDTDKESYALKEHPEGRGVEAATLGKEARFHFKRIRAVPTL